MNSPSSPPAAAPATRFEFSGNCSPGAAGVRSVTWRRFSVGIYPIVPRADGKGTKRGAVVVRVTGSTDAQGVALVEAKAREIITILEAGAYIGPKSVSVFRS